MYFRFSTFDLFRPGVLSLMNILILVYTISFWGIFEESKIHRSREALRVLSRTMASFYMLFLHGFLLTCVSVFLLSTIGGIKKRFLLCCAILKISPAFYFFSLILIPAFLVCNRERVVLSSGDR